MTHPVGRELLLALAREQRWVRQLTAYVEAESARLHARGGAVHVMQTKAACERIKGGA